MALDMNIGQSASGSGKAGEWHIISPEDEIKELERKLEQKKQELSLGTQAPIAAGSTEEKAVFREVMREHMGEALPQSTQSASPDSVPTAPPVVTGTLQPSAPQHSDPAQGPIREEKLRVLIERALEGTIQSAVDTAAGESPYLLDALHDRLTDEYYDKLVQLRKIEAM